jgi:hypothetical protein
VQLQNYSHDKESPPKGTDGLSARGDKCSYETLDRRSGWGTGKRGPLTKKPKQLKSQLKGVAAIEKSTQGSGSRSPLKGVATSPLKGVAIKSTQESGRNRCQQSKVRRQTEWRQPSRQRTLTKASQERLQEWRRREQTSSVNNNHSGTSKSANPTGKVHSKASQGRLQEWQPMEQTSSIIKNHQVHSREWQRKSTQGSGNKVHSREWQQSPLPGVAAWSRQAPL